MGLVSFSIQLLGLLVKKVFLRAMSSLNYLKLRAGYGVNGQQDNFRLWYISNYFQGSSTAQYQFW